VERPFELHTDDGPISSRADVILDKEGGASGSLAVVDLHALREGERSNVSLGEVELAEADAKARAALAGIRAGSFPPKPTEKKCAACDFREICGKRPTQPADGDI
jgi:CRISPR/Cas system-associated exonuclease Cas4 (RecB family)